MTDREAVREVVTYVENQHRPPIRAETLTHLKSWLALTEGKRILMLTQEEAEVLTGYLRDEISNEVAHDDAHAKQVLPTLKLLWIQLTGKEYPRAA
jgi:hypothetical protein